MAGLLYNPMFNAGMGLLAAGGPSRFPVGFGQALNQGLLQAQGADVTGQKLGFMGQEADQRSQLLQLKQQAIQEEQAQAAQRQAAMQRLGGLLTPQQQAMMAAGIDPEKILGMPGGLLAAPPDPTSLARELEEYHRLPEGDPRRAVYERKFAAIGSPTTSITNAPSFGPAGPDLDMDTASGKRIADVIRLQSAIAGMPPGPPRDSAEMELANMLREQSAPATQAGTAFADTSARSSVVGDKIDEALAMVNSGTTGLMGTISGFVPGSQSYDLDATLETIKANIGFQELGRIKAQSPTGGALGQISERELSRLEAVAGSLDKGQSKELLKKNLESIRQQTKESWTNVLKAYFEQFGRLPGEAQEYADRFGVDLNEITGGNSGVIDLTGY